MSAPNVSRALAAWRDAGLPDEPVAPARQALARHRALAADLDAHQAHVAAEYTQLVRDLADGASLTETAGRAALLHAVDPNAHHRTGRPAPSWAERVVDDARARLMRDAAGCLAAAAHVLADHAIALWDDAVGHLDAVDGVGSADEAVTSGGTTLEAWQALDALATRWDLYRTGWDRLRDVAPLPDEARALWSRCPGVRTATVEPCRPLAIIPAARAYAQRRASAGR